MIIEKITGATYTSNLESRIIDKLGLQNTEYGNEIELEKNEAVSMLFQSGNWIKFPLEWDMSTPFSPGAIASTPSDLNKFMRALFKQELISETSINSMKTVTRGLGHGLFKVPFYDRQAFGHNGRIDSFNSGSYYFEKDDSWRLRLRAITLMANLL